MTMKKPCMDKETMGCLVGGHTRFNYKGVTLDFSRERKIAEKDLKTAFAVGGRICIIIIAELLYRYKNEPYYASLRSALNIGKYEDLVDEYMNFGVQEREDNLKLSLKSRNREEALIALKYFISTYPRRKKNFKELLTREEYLDID